MSDQPIQTLSAVVNVAGLVRHAADTFGPSSALEFENGETFTFTELASRVAWLASELQRLDVKEGERILVALDNRSTLPLTVLAAGHYGAAVVPVNLGYTDSELKHLVDSLRPSHVIALPDFASTHRAVIEHSGARLLTVDQSLDWTELFEAEGEANYEDLGRRNHLSIPVRFGSTSGSSGFPKSVPKTHHIEIMNGRAIKHVLSLGPADRVLSSQPLYYGDPFMLLMACLQSGATCIILSRFRSQTFMDQVAQRAATKFITIGAMPAMIASTPRREEDRQHSVRAAWCVAIPRTLHHELETRFGFPWYEMYGAAETGGVLAERHGLPHTAGAGWLGELCPDMEVRLVDFPASTVVEGDGIGILDARGPTVCAGYWERPEESSAVFLPGGWYRTGDLIEREGNQYRYLQRMKDIVRRSGENVSCQEVEAALRECELVDDAAVVARPDELRGEEIWAFVLLRDSPATADVAEEIVSSVRERLSRHKVPRFVSFVDRFDRTPSERVIKRNLLAGTDTVIYDMGERGQR